MRPHRLGSLIPGFSLGLSLLGLAFAWPESGAAEEPASSLPQDAMPSLVIDEPTPHRTYRSRNINLRVRARAPAGLRRVLASANGAAPEIIFVDPAGQPATEAEIVSTFPFRDGQNMLLITVEDGGGATGEGQVSFLVREPAVRKGWFWAVVGLVLVAAGATALNLRGQAEQHRLEARSRDLEEEVARATEELRRSHGDLEKSHSRLEVSHVDLEKSHFFLKARSNELGAANARLEAMNRELVETQMKLVQSEKMAALGQLVAGVAHELNTPVGVIKANLDVLSRVVARLAELGQNLPPEAAAAVERNLKLIGELEVGSAKAIERVTRMVQGLRSFSGLDEATLQQADLRPGIESALTLLEYRLRDREVVRDYAEIPAIVCNPAALNQVFMQLLTNAADATNSRLNGRISIRTRHDGDWVEVVIEDNGVGIPEESLPRIFDPGFTTRGVGVGTGLGLAIVYRIVTEHGGEVAVRSRSGEGTAFTVRLPLSIAKSPALASPNSPNSNAPAAGAAFGSGSRIS